MKLVTFAGVDGPRLGAIVQAGILDLSAAAELERVANFPRSMQAFIEYGEAGLAMASALIETQPPGALVVSPRLLAPLSQPIRVRDTCMFLEHMEVGLAKIESMLDRGSLEPPADDSALQLEKAKLHPEFYNQIIYYNADHLHVYGPEDDIPWPNS